MVVETLGPRPEDPVKASLWNEGVDLILAFRQRHRLTARTGDPLGPNSGGAVRRRERERAALRLARIQRELDFKRVRTIDGPAIKIAS
jgi:hypothetical protein